MVNRNHGGSAVLEQFKNFKGIYLIVEYNIGNEEGTLTQLLFEI